MLAGPASLLPDDPPRPRVWGWYVAFCVTWAVFYAFAIAVTAYVTTTASEPPPDTMVMRLTMAIWLGFCAVLMVVYAVAPRLPRRPWAWIYGIAIIAFSALGGCFFVAIPLLVFWVRPDVQAFFGRAPKPPAPAPLAGPTGSLGPSADEARIRRVRLCYIVLLVVTALTYAGIGVVGLWSLVDPEMAGDRFEDTTLAVVGCVFFPIFAAGALLPRRPWAWKIGTGFIIATMLTCCTLPFAIPLLVAWLDARTKAAFGAS